MVGYDLRATWEGSPAPTDADLPAFIVRALDEVGTPRQLHFSVLAEEVTYKQLAAAALIWRALLHLAFFQGGIGSVTVPDGATDQVRLELLNIFNSTGGGISSIVGDNIACLELLPNEPQSLSKSCELAKPRITCILPLESCMHLDLSFFLFPPRHD